MCLIGDNATSAAFRGSFYLLAHYFERETRLIYKRAALFRSGPPVVAATIIKILEHGINSPKNKTAASLRRRYSNPRIFRLAFHARLARDMVSIAPLRAGLLCRLPYKGNIF